MCQPFIIGSSVSQVTIHEMGTTTDSEHSGFGSISALEVTKTTIKYMTKNDPDEGVPFLWITFMVIAKETWYPIVLNF